ncbi:MAG TPA: type II toxin-antitoxin system Phd/YefM family antitoxin [Kofleriaceae bacterium]|nr:type II toxin-antitoxin system Phd/YefM family antitoxin [Kofleriaceae bacterium]
MTKPSLAEDLVPIAEFKTHASRLLRRMGRTLRPLVITQNGKAAAVVLTPAEYDALGGREALRAEIDASLEAARRGAVSLDDAVERARIKAVGRRRRGAAS